MVVRVYVVFVGARRGIRWGLKQCFILFHKGGLGEKGRGEGLSKCLVWQQMAAKWRMRSGAVV